MVITSRDMAFFSQSHILRLQAVRRDSEAHETDPFLLELGQQQMNKDARGSLYSGLSWDLRREGTTIPGEMRWYQPRGASSPDEMLIPGRSLTIQAVTARDKVMPL